VWMELQPAVDALVRALTAKDFDAAAEHLEALRAAMPGAELGPEDELRLAEGALRRAYATGRASEVRAAMELRDDVRRRLGVTAQPLTELQQRRVRAIAALRASARLGDDGELVPAYSQVARQLGEERTQLRRWWAEKHAGVAPMEGEVIEDAAHRLRAEAEQSIRAWVKGPMERWRRMVEVVTSEDAVRYVEDLARRDFEAAARSVALIGKVLEAVPVVHRIGEDATDPGGTSRLEEVRRRLERTQTGRMLGATD